MNITEEQCELVIQGIRCLMKPHCGGECMACIYHISVNYKRPGFCDRKSLSEDLEQLMQDLRREG